MSAELTRVMIVAAAVAVALGAAWWARRWAARRGPVVDASGLLEGPGVVIFTKDDCATCVEMLERLATLDLPIRQVRAEDEPRELEKRSVTAVPVTVIQDGAGRPRAQFTGLAPTRPLRRAARRTV
jgi:glutaredoxin